MRNYKIICVLLLICVAAVLPLIFSFNYRTKPIKYDIIYAINMDSSPERLSLLDNQFKKYNNLSYKRFPASDGYQVKLRRIKDGQEMIGRTLKSFPRGYFKDEIFEITCSSSLPIIHTNLFLSAGEVGITCSHIRIWEDIVKNNYQAAIIIEDDIFLAEDFINKLSNILENAPADADFIGLGVTIKSILTLKPLIFSPVFSKMKANNANDGAFGYLVTNKGARILLENSKVMKNAIDNYIFNIADILNVYTVTPPIIKHNFDLKSEIFDMGRGF